MRVYPLQILLWHELVNDRIAGLPVLASFCPLCNAAVAFDRRVDGEALPFGVSGLLRNSDMVMFDRQTESLWQQLTGEAIVGAHTGKRLAIVSSQIVPFRAAAQAFQSARVLGRDTGHRRPYGTNPYVGYETAGRTMFPVSFRSPGSVRPLDRILTFTVGRGAKAYLMRQLRKSPVQNGGGRGAEYVVFCEPDTISPLAARKIAESPAVGSAAVFRPIVDGKRLVFELEGDAFVDRATSSRWNLFGRAISGPLQGQSLEPIEHGVYYAFAWYAFRPQTELVRLD